MQLTVTRCNAHFWWRNDWTSHVIPDAWIEVHACDTSAHCSPLKHTATHCNILQQFNYVMGDWVPSNLMHESRYTRVIPQQTTTHCNNETAPICSQAMREWVMSNLMHESKNNSVSPQHPASYGNTLQQHTSAVTQRVNESFYTWCINRSTLVWHLNTLQPSATHCNTLQHSATLCNTLQHFATHCISTSHAHSCGNNTLQQAATRYWQMSESRHTSHGT